MATCGASRLRENEVQYKEFMTQTPKTQADGIRLPSTTDVYDALMGDIEPDLVSVSLPTLGQRYRGETADQKKAREARYAIAFDKYDKAFDEWAANFHLAISAYRYSAINAAENRSKTEDSATLQAIESQFQS